MRMAMMAITTSSSIRVNADRRDECGLMAWGLGLGGGGTIRESGVHTSRPGGGGSHNATVEGGRSHPLSPERERGEDLVARGEPFPRQQRFQFHRVDRLGEVQ